MTEQPKVEPGDGAQRDELQQLTIAEVQARLRLGRTKVFELCRRGDLEVRKFGRATRISERSLHDYVERALRVRGV